MYHKGAPLTDLKTSKRLVLFIYLEMYRASLRTQSTHRQSRNHWPYRRPQAERQVAHPCEEWEPRLALWNDIHVVGGITAGTFVTMGYFESVTGADTSFSRGTLRIVVDDRPTASMERQSNVNLASKDIDFHNRPRYVTQ